MMKLLVVEDDQSLCESVVDWLRTDYEVEFCADGMEAAEMLNRTKFDVIVLDVGLPSIDGFELCQRYRQAGGQAIVLLLTGKSETDHKVTGLDSGADDYLTKPFSLLELSARLRALSRRTGPLQSNLLCVEKLRLDLKDRKVSYDSMPVTLSPQEFTLLEFRMRHKGQIFSQHDLIDRVWNSSSAVSGESVRKSIARLRKALAVYSGDELVQTISGVGYKIDDREKNANSLEPRAK